MRDMRRRVQRLEGEQRKRQLPPPMGLSGLLAWKPSPRDRWADASDRWATLEEACGLAGLLRGKGKPACDHHS